MTGILIWGGGSQARIILEMVIEDFPHAKVVIYDYSLDALSFGFDGEFINRKDVLLKALDRIDYFIVAIGNSYGFARFSTSIFLETEFRLSPLTLVHKAAFVETKSSVGKGGQIMPMALVHKFCEIGDYVILNSASTLDHECKVGNGVHVMGNAAIAGRVRLGNFVTIGTNATILPDIEIGEGAYVGAGAVVTKNVAPREIVIGAPAKHLKYNELSFDQKTLFFDR